MDRTLMMIKFNRDNYITWLVECMGYNEHDALEMADYMGY